MVDDVPANPPEPEQNEDGSEEADDENDNEYEPPSECQLCMNRTQRRTLLHEMAEHPYYFASGFFLIGVMIQASHPFVNWQLIWFMMMQAMLNSIAMLMGVGMGIIAPLYFTFLEHLVNVWAILLRRPKRMRLVPEQTYNINDVFSNIRNNS